MSSLDVTFKFLKGLKKNNNRDWFESHRADYEAAREGAAAVIDKVITGVRKFDRLIGADMDAGDCMFRIYKDVRFSKDKTPYKTNFGASISPGGKKSPVAGYYVHLEPDASFVAGGMWMPEPAALNAIRQEIDYQPEALLKIFKSKKFREYFNGLSEEDQLKTAPKGYAKDHPHIDLIRNRHFIVVHDIPSKALNAQPEKYIVNACSAMYPFLCYLREATS